ncbi:MAG: hypothetical protein Fues2KO_45580 [Fuerstiella sp.]
MTELVLSLFPGVGLLDRAFRETAAVDCDSTCGEPAVCDGPAFCVCAGPDRVTGGDVCDFAGVAGRFDGIIAGPPCQGFSVANQFRSDDSHPSVQNSREMLRQTLRIIDECRPEWFLIENVPTVPDVRLAGYSVQRIAISDWECGGVQLRSRVIQFGSLAGDIIRPKRVNDETRNRKKGRPPRSITTKSATHVDFPDVCRRQGLPQPLQLPGWHRTAKIRAVGNGVPLTMGRVLAAAVVCRAPRDVAADCACDCGRSVSTRALTATPSCRKRKQLQQQRPRPFVCLDGYRDPSMGLTDVG